MKDIEVLLGEFNTLEDGKVEYEVDRYTYVAGLGIFFFNGGFTDEKLVYSAIGFSAPQLIYGNGKPEHYYIKEEKKERNFGERTLYVKKKEKERVSNVAEGEPCVLKTYIQKIAYTSDLMYKSKEEWLENLDKPVSEEQFKKKQELLKLFVDNTKMLRLVYDGYAKVDTDGRIEWVKHSEVYSYDDALIYLKELCDRKLDV